MSKPASTTIDHLSKLLFFTGFAFLIGHELDAVARAEWKLLPIINQLSDEVAYTVFVASHIPLIVLLLSLTTAKSQRCRRISRFSVDAFLVFHVILHAIFSDHANYTFHSPLSKLLITGGGLVGILHIGLTLWHSPTPGD